MPTDARREALAAALIDLDNTLYDFDGAYSVAVAHVAETLARHGPHTETVTGRYSVLRRTIDASRHRSGRDARLARMRALLDSWPETRHLDAAEMVDTFERALHGAITWYPGARASLDAIRRQVPVVIVTEGWADIQQPILERLGLHPGGPSVLSTWTEHVTKADGSAYALALQWLGAPPEQVVMIGDNWELDVVAPSRLAIGGVWLSRRRPVPPEVPPHFRGTVEAVSAVPALLAMHKGGEAGR